MSPTLGVSEENLIEEGNIRRHIPGEGDVSKSKIDEATTESESVGTGVVEVSYNRLDPTVLRDGIDFVRVLENPETEDEYVSHGEDLSDELNRISSEYNQSSGSGADIGDIEFDTDPVMLDEGDWEPPEALKNAESVGIEHTDEEAAIVHDAARLSGTLDIDDVDDVEAARGEIADRLDVDVDRLRELVEPLESIYAIADHSRTLAYMFGDGIVPSNVGTGYLARMVLRRTKRLVDEVDVDAPLDELVDMQAERLGYENRDTIRDVVRTEVEKYRETLDRGTRRVESLAEEYAAEGEPIPTDELVELYDSHGIQPDMVAEIASDHGADAVRLRPHGIAMRNDGGTARATPARKRWRPRFSTTCTGFSIPLTQRGMRRLTWRVRQILKLPTLLSRPTRSPLCAANAAFRRRAMPSAFR